MAPWPRRCVVLFALVFLVQPVRADGCEVDAVADVPRCVSVGDRLHVYPSSGGPPVVGKLRGFADGRLVLDVGSHRFVWFDDADVRRISVTGVAARPLLLATGIGAGLGLALGLALGGEGSVAHCGAECKAYFTAMGAAFGVGAASSQIFNVERAIFDRQMVRPSGSDRPSAAARPAAPVFLTSVDQLPRRLAPSDRVRIRRGGNREVTGRYAGVTTDSLIVTTEQGETTGVPESDIITVERLTRPTKRKGAVGGAIVGAGLVLAGIAADRASDAPELTPADAVGGLAFFAGAGAAVGAFSVRFVNRSELILVRPTPATVANALARRGPAWRVVWSRRF
jgi:hypothetical protein